MNADDFGLSSSVNNAVLYCYQLEYINSSSLFATNTNDLAIYEALDMIKSNKVIKNVGIHINLDDGKPLTNFKNKHFLNEDGKWDSSKTGKKIKFLDTQTRHDFYNEIESQILKILRTNIKINHIDSHHHLHTLPGFYNLFLTAARKYKLKLRIAQTYNEGNYIKSVFRKYVNMKIKANGYNYSDFFETVDHFLAHKIDGINYKKTELMLHPDFDTLGKLTDHYSASDMNNWLSYLKK
ncbi:ChbG/HpnK family deacetylase [Mucilaginibacter sp.]